MKRKPTKSHMRRRIAFWHWAVKNWPDCEGVKQTAQYIIAKYERELKVQP